MGARKKLLILGGTGFIGMALLKKLRAYPDQFETLILAHKNIPFKELEDFNVCTGNLVDLDLSIVDQYKPDYIIHMARLRGSGTAGRGLAARRGQLANRRLIRHLKKQAEKPVVIYVSGTLVYGDCGQETAYENNPVRPTGFSSQYSIAERPWVKECIVGSLPVFIMRPPWIVGNRSWFKTFYIDVIKNENKIPIYGEGFNWMSLIDLQDCAGLILHGIQNGIPGNIYNIFNPGSILRQLEFSSEISDIAKLPYFHLHETDMVSKYGRAAWESLTFSLKSGTLHPEWLRSYSFIFPDIHSILKNNLGESSSIKASTSNGDQGLAFSS